MATLLPTSSPKWSSTTKLVVGLTIGAIIAGLIIYFRSIIGPLLLAFILSYLLHPIANRLSQVRGLSWRFSVSTIYIVLVLLIIASTTLTGLAVVQEAQDLVDIVQQFLSNLPSILDELSSSSYKLGPFTIDLSGYLNLDQLGDQLINTLQLLVGQVGAVVGTVASGAANILGWTIFVVIVSYFILADSRKVTNTAHFLDLPAYAEDIRRISREFARLWNAFLRGQITIVVIVIITYSLLLAILGVRYSIAIAILTGLARFVPYLGPFITYIIMGLVTIFQSSNFLGVEPWQFSIIVIGICVVVDQIFDNLVSPRILGQRLGVHPAAVLVVAIIATNLIGIIGLVLAAPVLASIQLIGRYVARKMFDQDPWPEVESKEIIIQPTWFMRILLKFRTWWHDRKR